jgi:hypothetical protein
MINFKPSFDKDEDPGKQPGCVDIVRTLRDAIKTTCGYPTGGLSSKPSGESGVLGCNDDELS